MGGRKNAMLLKKTERGKVTAEQLQCKEEYLCTPCGTLPPASLLLWPCLCTECMHETNQNEYVMQIPDIRITNPQSYCGLSMANLPAFRSLHRGLNGVSSRPGLFVVACRSDLSA